MLIPAAAECRAILEGYDINTESQVTGRTGDLSLASPVVQNINTAGLRPQYRVSGTGIPAGTRVLSVDSATQLTMDAPATAAGAGVALTFVYYPRLSDQAIVETRDRLVIPFIEAKTGQSVGVEGNFVEYHSGGGGTILVLEHRPVKALVSVEYVSAGSPYAVVLTAFELLAEEGILKSKVSYNEGQWEAPVFPRGTLNIKVTVTRGWADVPAQVHEAIRCLTMEACLGIVEGRTGGGDLSVQAFGRSFGKRGKYSNARNDLARRALAMLTPYLSRVAG